MCIYRSVLSATQETFATPCHMLQIGLASGQKDLRATLSADKSMKPYSTSLQTSGCTCEFGAKLVSTHDTLIGGERVKTYWFIGVNKAPYITEQVNLNSFSRARNF